EDRDDGDHHQQLDQREGEPTSVTHSGPSRERTAMERMKPQTSTVRACSRHRLAFGFAFGISKSNRFGPVDLTSTLALSFFSALTFQSSGIRSTETMLVLLGPPASCSFVGVLASPEVIVTR